QREAGPDLLGGLVRRGGPDILVEDLHLDVAGVARGGDRGADRREVDVPVADVAPAEQGVGGQRQDPVADLVADDSLPRPRDVGGQRRVPPHVVGVHHDADRVGGELPGRVITQRSAANIGCSASMPSRTPCAWATGTSSPMAPAIIRLARAMSRLPGTSPPETRTSVPAPSAAASAIAALLPAAAAARAAGSAWVKNPPRQRLETRSPAARTAAAAAARPSSATGSRHSPIAPIPCRAHSATASGTPSRLTVAWLSDSRPSAVTGLPRSLGFPRSLGLLEERGHPADRQVRVDERPGRHRQLEDAGQVGGRAPALEAVEH